MSLTFEITFVEDEVLDDLEGDDEERIATIMFREERPHISLGRAWHMIHALLTETTGKSSGPLSFIVGGGRTLDDQDPNGGWVCAYDSSEVAKIQAALPSASTLAKRYQEQGLPDGVAWASRVKGEADAEYFLEPYRELVDAMKQAVDDEHGMLAGLI